jgi:hypothetical protein
MLKNNYFLKDSPRSKLACVKSARLSDVSFGR